MGIPPVATSSLHDLSSFTRARERRVASVQIFTPFGQLFAILGVPGMRAVAIMRIIYINPAGFTSGLIICAQPV